MIECLTERNFGKIMLWAFLVLILSSIMGVTQNSVLKLVALSSTKMDPVGTAAAARVSSWERGICFGGRRVSKCNGSCYFYLHSLSDLILPSTCPDLPSPHFSPPSPNLKNLFFCSCLSLAMAQHHICGADLTPFWVPLTCFTERNIHNTQSCFRILFRIRKSKQNSEIE